MPSIHDQLQTEPCISSHSHLVAEEVRLSTSYDPIDYLLNTDVYLVADLRSAGLTDQVAQHCVDLSVPLPQRWAAFAPFWERVRFTGFSQCYRLAFAELFDIGELTPKSICVLAEKLNDWIRPGTYQQFLHDTCRVKRCILNMEDLEPVNRSLFHPLPRLTRFNRIWKLSQVQAIEQDYDVSIRSLEDLVHTIHTIVDQWQSQSIAGLKFIQSNRRRLDFVDVAQSTAAPVFCKILAGEEICIGSAEGKLLEDFLVFECCRAASQHRLTLQFHVGMRACNYRRMDGCSPTPLIPLLRTFKETSFDLSHAGFPYFREAAVLAKTYPNVYLNMSWVHIISPTAASQALQEWVRSVPVNKIIGFGDDLMHLEPFYGHLRIARQNISSALEALIDEAVIVEPEALAIAQAILYENPRRLYKIHTA